MIYLIITLLGIIIITAYVWKQKEGRNFGNTDTPISAEKKKEKRQTVIPEKPKPVYFGYKWDPVRKDMTRPRCTLRYLVQTRKNKQMVKRLWTLKGLY